MSVFSRVFEELKNSGTTGDEYTALLMKAIEGLSSEDLKTFTEQNNLVIELTGEYKDRNKAIEVMEELYA